MIITNFITPEFLTERKATIMQPTSLEANKKSKPHRENNYNRILSALRKMPKNEGIAELIASYCSIDKAEAGRRCGEMAKLGLIHDTGRKGKTSKACSAIIWKISEEPKTATQIQQSLFN
jgi:hypothetical protein